MVRHFADRPIAITRGAVRATMRLILSRRRVAMNAAYLRRRIPTSAARRSKIPAMPQASVFATGLRRRIGWIKTVTGPRQTKLRGRPQVDWAFTFAAAAYNLVRAPELIAAFR
jgi:hypothetical protein